MFLCPTEEKGLVLDKMIVEVVATTTAKNGGKVPSEDPIRIKLYY